MTVHLNTQADLDRAIHALVEQDPRLQPVLKLTGMPALRRREPGYAGLAAIVCGQQLSTASAAAIWARVSAAFDPFHHDALRRARTERLGRLGLSSAKIKTLKNLARELAAERLNLDVLADEDADAARESAAHASFRRIFATSFGIVFLAEWGDITQITIANFTARYAEPVAVGVGAALGLASVAALAVNVGAQSLKHIPMAWVQRITGTVLLGFGIYSAVQAITG